MRLGRFLKDRLIYICIMLFCIANVYLMGIAFKCNRQYIYAVIFLLVAGMAVYLAYEYIRRSAFYNNALEMLDRLEEKYLITEMLKKPGFAEGDIMLDMLYDINKAQLEAIGHMEKSMTEFKEYIEMWVHEVKVPLSSLDLMNYNMNTDFEAQKKQIDKLTFYTEQILFYTRADAAEKDYLMKRCNLEAMVNKVVKEQKNLILGNKISIEKNNISLNVISDSKWLEFMLSQIVNNSIKYLIMKKDEAVKQLSFTGEERQDTVVLTIRDNGIGISEKDIPRVFDKSFTGENGRASNASTGMGLYICRRLCEKLGHTIDIRSVQGEYTEVTITFGIDKYYEFR